MNNDLTLATRLKLDGSQYVRGLDNAERRTATFVRQMESRYGAFGGVVARSSVAMTRGLDLVINRYTALAAGVAGMQAARGVIALDARLTRLGANANMSAEQVENLKQQVFGVARQADIAVGYTQILDAIDGIIEKTGDLSFARDNLRSIGLAIQATGAQGAEIGSIVAEFQKMGFNVNETAQALDILSTLGDAGAFTLQKLASLGPRVVTAYTALGRTGVPAIREMGAALQIIQQGTGSAEQAATAFEAVLRSLSDNNKIKALRKIGVEVFDAKKLKEGRKELIPINKLMQDIVRQSRGDLTVLGDIFDAEAVRAFNSLATKFLNTGTMDALDRFMEATGDGSNLLRKSATNAATYAAQMERLHTAWAQFADANLAAPIDALADALGKLDNETVDKWLDVGKAIGAVAAVWGAGKLIKKVAPAVTNAFKWLAPAATYDSMGIRTSAGTVFSRASSWTTRAMAPTMARAAPYLSKLGTAMPLGKAFAYGYGAGSIAYPMMPESWQDNIGGATAWAAAGLGNDEAQEARAIRQKFEGSLNIEVTDSRIKVTQLHSNSSNLQMNVDTRGTMGSPL